MSNPGKAHWCALKHLLRFLKDTESLSLVYNRSGNLTLFGFSDSYWATVKDYRKSTSGFCFKLSRSGSVVSWASKRQGCVALNSCEAEYVSLTSYQLTSQSDCLAAVTHETVAAVSKPTGCEKPGEIPASSQCTFCGSSYHPRMKCPARRDNCHSCGKQGHWAMVCRSSSFSAQSSVPESSESPVLCTLSATTSNTTVYATVRINNIDTIEALIDPGATDCFITRAAAVEFKLHISYKRSQTRLASGQSFVILGSPNCFLGINGETYKCHLFVVETLIADLICLSNWADDQIHQR